MEGKFESLHQKHLFQKTNLIAIDKNDLLLIRDLLLEHGLELMIKPDDFYPNHKRIKAVIA